MDAKTREALEASIEKWKRNAAEVNVFKTSISNKDCALCSLFYDDDCQGCPVSEKSGRKFCGNTPYLEASAARGIWFCETQNDGPAFRTAALEEVAFLESLRPEDGT